MSARAPIVDRIRIIPRPNDFLDRNVGSSGELFFDRDNKTVRVYDGDDRGGFEVVTQANIAKSTSLQGVSSYRYDVTITGPEPGDTGNKYNLNDEYNPELTLVIGYSYVFDQNDSTNVYFPNPTGSTPNPHPLNFSSTGPNGPLYTDGVIYYMDGREVTQQKYIDDFNTALDKKVIITITKDTPTTLYYYCSNHENMGNTITTSVPGTGSGGASLTSSDTAPENPDNGSLWYNSTNGFLYVYIQDEDSAQWIQPSVPTPKQLTDLNIADGANNQVLTTDGSGSFFFQDIAISTIDNFNFSGSTLTAVDDGSLTIDAPLTLQSINFGGTSVSGISNDSSLINSSSTAVVTENAVKNYVDTALGGSLSLTSIALPLGNTINDFSNDGTFSDNSTSAVPTENAVKTYVDNVDDNVRTYVDDSISGIDLSTFSSAVTFEDFVTFQETTEVVNKKSSATGVVDHDLTEGAVWYHYNVAGNFTVNLTNVPVTIDRTLSIAIIVDQQAIPYEITALTIDGGSVSINWQDGIIPSPTGSQYDIYTFTLFRRSVPPVAPIWIAFGGLTTYA